MLERQKQISIKILSSQVLALGGSVSPANTAFLQGELSQQIQASSSKVLFSSASLLPTATAAFEECSKQGLCHHLIVIGGDESHSSSSGVVSMTALMADDGAAFSAPPAIDTDNAVAFLPYSSGTTGLPKGVMLTHRNMVANQLQCLNPIFDTTEPGRKRRVLSHRAWYTVLIGKTWNVCL